MPRFVIPAILLIQADDPGLAERDAAGLCREFIKRHDKGPHDLRGPLLRACGASKPTELPEMASHYPFTLHGYGPEAARATGLAEERDIAVHARDRARADLKDANGLIGILTAEAEGLRTERDQLRVNLERTNENLRQARYAALAGIDIGAAVDRFLSWPMPPDFAPDAGIGFVPPPANVPWVWPTGTNLFHAGQARAMFEHALNAGPAPVDVKPTIDGLIPTEEAEKLTESLHLGDFHLGAGRAWAEPTPEWDGLTRAIAEAVGNISSLSLHDTTPRNVLVDHLRGLCQLQREGFVRVLNPPRMFQHNGSLEDALAALSFNLKPRTE